MKYELINPSDKIYFEGDFPLVAMGYAITLLGEGMYALNDSEGETVVPMFWTGDACINWFRQQGTTLDGAMVDHAENAAAFLDTLTYAHERSSLNDIGKRAKGLAGRLREIARERKPRKEGGEQ